MTERERWVVYPLLFLALGAALRDKLVDRTITKSIFCQELAIVDEVPLGNQSARVLARIGRSDPKSGTPACANFMLNGHMEIIDDDPASNKPPRSLIVMGRTDSTPRTPSIGYAKLSGEVDVDGVMNTKQYAYQNVLFVPLPMFLGIGGPDMWRALQRPGPAGQKPQAPNTKSLGKQPKAPPPAQDPKGSRDTPPPAPAGEQPRATK